MPLSEYYSPLFKTVYGKDEQEFNSPYAPQDLSQPTAQPIAIGSGGMQSTDPNMQLIKDYYKKKLPNLFATSADQYQQNVVTPEEKQQTYDDTRLANLASGLSKAGSLIGNVGGEAVKTTAPETLQSFAKTGQEQLAQREKTGNEAFQNMGGALSAMQGIRKNALDEQKEFGTISQQRELSDPNSDTSKAARLTMANYGIKLPETASAAYIEKEFNPGDLFKQQQSQSYESKKLEQQFNQQMALKKMELDAKLKSGNQQYENLSKQDQFTLKDLSESNAKKIVIANQIDGFLTQFDAAKDDEDKTWVVQKMIKILNSTEGQDAVGAEEAKRLANELEPWTLKSPSGFPRFGKDTAGFRLRSENVASSLRNAIGANQKVIDHIAGVESNTSRELKNQPGSPSQTVEKKKVKVFDPTTYGGG